MDYIDKLIEIKKVDEFNTQTKMAVKLGVHVASVRLWFAGMKPNKDNETKIDNLYEYVKREG